MSDLSDLILPAGLVVLGAYAIKKMFAAGAQEDWIPESKFCLGPICYSTYASQVTAVQRVQTQPKTNQAYTNADVPPQSAVQSGTQKTLDALSWLYSIQQLPYDLVRSGVSAGLSAAGVYKQ